MVTDNHYRWDFIGLSTDQKPTPSTSPKVVDGSTFYCSDNSKLYVWCADQWYERKALGGGGGGGGTSDFDELENRPKYNGSEMTSLTDIPQIQYETMPTASQPWLGRIIQYVGETQSGYTQGFFYECTELMAGIYTWTQIKSSPDPVLPVAFLQYGDTSAWMTVMVGMMAANKTIYFVLYQDILYQFTSTSTGNVYNFTAIDGNKSYKIELSSTGWGTPTSETFITTSNNPIHNDYYFGMPAELSVKANTAINLYPDNLLTQNYLLKWGRFTDSTTIRNYDNYITLTPTTKSTKDIQYSVYDRFLNLMDSGNTVLKIKDTAPATQTMLMIGDSFISQNSIEPKLRTLFSDDNHTLTLIGTKGSGDNKNEGYAGWKYTDFVSGDKAPTSAFWDGTKFNFTYYMQQNSYSTLDSVYIQLGTNDASAASVNQDLSATVSAANTIVDSILGYNPNIKIYLGLTVMPTLNSVDFASHYNGVGWNWVMRANMQKLNKLLIDSFADNSSVSIVATNLVLDSTTDISDNVHPNSGGYQKMANQLYYTMMTQS